MSWGYIKKFNNQYVSLQDRVVLTLALVMLIYGATLLLINRLVFSFPGNQYLPIEWLFLLPFILVMLCLSCWAREMAPRLCNFTRFYTLYYFLLLGMALLMDGIQLSPFSTIDHTLAVWDQMLGVNTPALLAWVAGHPLLKTILEIGYEAITWQIFFVSVVLALFKKQRAVNEYFVLVSLVVLVSATIYYFLPTGAPASVFHSPYFLSEEHATALKFYQIHHYIQPTTNLGGLIAFPSDHVLFALVCLYVSRHRVWLFLPLLVINVVGIFATVLLGWHYLLDVMASMLIFGFLVGLLRYMQKKFKY